MAYANGRIPLSALTRIQPFGHLLHEAAASYEAMRQAAAHDGVTLRPEGPDASSYRDEAWQRYYKRYWCGQGHCEKAAEPGTSNHGTGRAVDFHLGPGVFAWLSANAHRFGWSHAEGARVGELWHWVYVGGFKPAPARDPLWFLTATERRWVREYRRLARLAHPTHAQTARRKDLWHALADQRGRIYHAAHAKGGGGWDKAHRRARYRVLAAITK